MATPADQRLLELLDKWLKSLELHAKYSSLDDDSYWKIQAWVEHQRPEPLDRRSSDAKNRRAANPCRRAHEKRRRQVFGLA